MTLPTCTFLDRDEWGDAVPCGAPADWFDDLNGGPRCDRHCAGCRRVTPWPAGYRVTKWHMDGGALVIDEAVLEEVSFERKAGN